MLATGSDLYSVVAFTPGDLKALNPGIARQMLQHLQVDDPYAWTALRNGFPIACAGIRPLWPGRAECWTVLGDVGRWGLLWITRRILAQMPDVQDGLKLRRLEATCLLNWRPGMRWLQMLGFHYEGRMIAYDPDGRDHMLWAKTWHSSQHSQSD